MCLLQRASISEIVSSSTSAIFPDDAYTLVRCITFILTQNPNRAITVMSPSVAVLRSNNAMTPYGACKEL